MTSQILLVAIAALGGLTFLLATLLILANRRLFVFEDPRIDQVEELLPHANCGGCGYPSCHAFAEALVNGDTLPGKCNVSTSEQRENIAAFLHVDVGEQIKQVARLACAGGNNVAFDKAAYIGPSSCISANQVGGGSKACSWGCLGFGDCERACTFGAIHMSANDLPTVDADKCTACGDCVTICPKELFSLQPINRHLWVACKNLEQGETVLESCQVGCTGCARCQMDARDQHIALNNHLPVIDYQKSLGGGEAIERCPTGAIVWVDEHNQIVRGREAIPLPRQTPLPPLTS